MSGVVCVIILDGESVQGNAAELASTASASCQLVDYLDHDEDIEFDVADAQPIADFHARTKSVLSRLNRELDSINRALAAKYNRSVS